MQDDSGRIIHAALSEGKANSTTIGGNVPELERAVVTRCGGFYIDLTKAIRISRQRSRFCSNICAINTCLAAVWGKCDASRATTFRLRRFAWKIGPWVIPRQMYAVPKFIAKAAVCGFSLHMAFLDWRCLEYCCITFRAT